MIWKYVAAVLAIVAVTAAGATKLTQLVLDNHYRGVHETCGKALPTGAYDRCPVEIQNALNKLDLHRVEKVIEYRDRIIKVQDKTAAEQVVQKEELQSDLSDLQAMTDETLVIDSPYIDAVRRQLCERQGDCPSAGPAPLQPSQLRGRTVPSDLPGEADRRGVGYLPTANPVVVRQPRNRAERRMQTARSG